MENEKTYVALFKADSKIYLLLTPEKPLAILGFKGLNEGLAYFEDAYNTNHNRNYEASMSACINFIQFQPKIVTFDSIDELTKVIDGEPRALKLSSVSGIYNVCKLKDVEGLKNWEDGVTPKLIS